MRRYTPMKKRSWLLVLLGVPFIVLLLPFLYNFEQPAFIGIPFFYWFQMFLVVIISIIIAALYSVRG